MQSFEQHPHLSEQYQAQPMYETVSGSQDENPQSNEQQYYYQTGYQMGYIAGQQKQPNMPPNYARRPEIDPVAPPLNQGWIPAYIPSSAFYSSFNAFHLSEPSILSRLGAAISYAGGWFTGLLLLLFGWHNRYVRFHALQSVLFFGCANILFVVGIGFARFPFAFFFSRGLAAIALMVLFAIVAIGWVVGIIGALSGRYLKLPFVGDIAERRSEHDVQQGTVK